MSLSAREQHVLDSIKEELTNSDPKLTGLMATFTRLASGEEMPLRERIWSGSRRAGRQPRGNRRDRGPGTMCVRPRAGRQRLGPSQRTLLLLWLLLSVLLIAVALILSHGTSRSASGCAEPWPAICADPASSHRPHPASTATSQPSAPTRQVIPGG